MTGVVGVLHATAGVVGAPHQAAKNHVVRAIEGLVGLARLRAVLGGGLLGLIPRLVGRHLRAARRHARASARAVGALRVCARQRGATGRQTRSARLRACGRSNLLGHAQLTDAEVARESELAHVPRVVEPRLIPTKVRGGQRTQERRACGLRGPAVLRNGLLIGDLRVRQSLGPGSLIGPPGAHGAGRRLAQPAHGRRRRIGQADLPGHLGLTVGPHLVRQEVGQIGPIATIQASQ